MNHRRWSLAAIAAMAVACLPGAAVSGQSADLSQVMIDVSSNNNLDKILPRAIERQIELVMIRATIGRGTPDKNFAANLDKVRLVPKAIMVGAYHALYPTSTGKEQAAEFLSVVKKSCQPGQKILLAVDWERPSLRGKLVNPAPAATLDDFITEVMAKTGGRKPIVYTDPGVIEENRASIDPTIAGSPLWLATYYSRVWRSKNCQKQTGDQKGFLCSNYIHGLLFPDVPDFAPWSDWAFWQFSEGSANDPEYLRRKISGDMSVDVSFFGGSRDEFRKFFNTYAADCDAIVI